MVCKIFRVFLQFKIANEKMENKNIVKKITKKELFKEQEEVKVTKIKPEKNVNNDFSEMISKLNTSSIQVHIFHWQVKGQGSHAAHEAFGSYYEAIPGLIDALVESYQGKYGVLTGYSTMGLMEYESCDKIINYFVALDTFIEQARAKCPQDSYIQNQIDGIQELIYSTMYKLKFLN